MGNSPLISASLITNEPIKPEVIKSILPHVDEIVIVYTGNQRLEKAKKFFPFTEKVFKFQWRDDFASARNFGLSKCEGDWIVSIDSDEIFHYEGNLKEYLASLDDNIGAVEVQIFSESGDGFIRTTLPRIFRRGCYFSNKIHENINQSLVELGKTSVLNKSIFIFHFGYKDEKVLLEKRKRNLAILKKALNSDPYNPVYPFYLAEGLLAGIYNTNDGNPEKQALEIFNHLLSSGINRSMKREICATLLKYSLLKKNLQIDWNLYKNILNEIDSNLALFYEGIKAYQDKNWEKTYQCLKDKYLEISELDVGMMMIVACLNTKRYEEGIEVFKKLPIQSPNARAYTAMCYMRLGDYTTARNLASEALNFNPLNPLATSIVNLIDENLYESKPYRILLVSPVRQKPEILSKVLNSWKSLNLEKCQLDFFFIDNNDNVESSRLLEEFPLKKEIVKFQPKLPYIRSGLHHWNINLVQQVAEFKDMGIKYALSNGYDYVFLVDSDLELHPDVLITLLKANKPIISGVFWTKYGNLYYPQVWLQDQISCYHVWGMELDKVSNVYKQQFQERFYEILKTSNIPIRVGGLGACTLVKRECLEKGLNFKPIYNVSFFGEDRWFCIRAVSLGYDLWAHPVLNSPIIHHYE